MRYYIRASSPEDAPLIAAWAGIWGYPRELSAEEVHTSQWYLLSGSSDTIGVAWFHRCPDPCPGDWWAIHAIAEPAARRRGVIGTQEIMRKLEGIAETLGAVRLYSLVPKELRGSGLPVDTMRRYLRKRGWSEDPLGAYIDLGVEV